MTTNRGYIMQQGLSPERIEQLKKKIFETNSEVFKALSIIGQLPPELQQGILTPLLEELVEPVIMGCTQTKSFYEPRMGLSRISVSSTSPLIAVPYDDGEVIIRTLPSYQEVSKFPTIPEWGKVMCFSADNTLLANADYNGSVEVTTVQTGRTASQFQTALQSVSSIAISPDNAHVVPCDKSNRIVEIWDVSTGNMRSQIHGIAFHAHLKELWIVVPEGKTIQIREFASQKVIQSFEISYNESISTAFSADGTLFALYSKKVIYVWDIFSGKMLLKQGSARDVKWITFSPDKRLLATGTTGEVRIWNVRTNRMLIENIGNTRELLFDSSGALIAQKAQEIILWQYPSVKDIYRFNSNLMLMLIYLALWHKSYPGQIIYLNWKESELFNTIPDPLRTIIQKCFIIRSHFWQNFYSSLWSFFI